MGSKKNSEGFTERLRAAMRHSLMNIRDLSEVADVSYEMARRYHSGEGMPRGAERIKAIAAALKIEVEWLMEGAGPGLQTKPLTYVALYSITDRQLSFARSSWRGKQAVAAPSKDFNGIAVEMGTPMGCETMRKHNISLFKQGDILYVTPADAEPPKNTWVLVEAKRIVNGERRYYVRQVQYRRHQKTEMTFISQDPERFPEETTNKFRIFGKISHISTKLD